MEQLCANVKISNDIFGSAHIARKTLPGHYDSIQCRL